MDRLDCYTSHFSSWGKQNVGCCAAWCKDYVIATILDGGEHDVVPLDANGTRGPELTISVVGAVLAAVLVAVMAAVAVVVLAAVAVVVAVDVAIGMAMTGLEDSPGEEGRWQ